MDANSFTTVEPNEEAQNKWTAHVAEVSDKLLRRRTNNYMVHVNEDGSRVYLPYAGGMDRYVKFANEIAANGYEGFEFTTVHAVNPAP